MNNSLLENAWAPVCVTVCYRNVCAKFKVDPLSRFHTGDRQVLPPRNHSLTKFLWPRKLQHQILFKHIFYSNYHLSSLFWNFTSLRSNKIMLEQRSKYLSYISVFSLLFHFFWWNGIKKKFSIKEDTRKMDAEKLFLQSYWE